MNDRAPAISIQNATIAVAGHLVLRNISLEIESGAFIGVLGTNGAGKTTLFRAILGLIKPVSGEIRVFGAPAQCGQTRVGYLPQARNLMPHIRLSCRDYLASGWNGQKWGLTINGAERNRAIDRVLSLTGARDLAHRAINELSGGERQRILIAQSLMGDPDLLILDEPLISLDPARQNDVIQLVKNLQNELHITVLFSAHELNPLLGALDKVLYLGQGGAVLGSVEDTVTGPVLSRLYGAPIEVLHVHGRIFVMAGSHDLAQHDHAHDHQGHAHG